MSALEKFSQQAARRYLQSAVFVDDHIFDQKTGMPTLPVGAPPQRKPIFRGAGGARPAARVAASLEEDASSGQPYHPKDLVSSFAREAHWQVWRRRGEIHCEGVRACDQAD